MLNVGKGTYYNLDEVGSQIWNILSLPHSLNELVTQIIDFYEVTPVECRNDIIPFLQDLLKKNLIEIKN